MVPTGAEFSEAQTTLEVANAKPITEVVNPSNGFNTTPLDSCYVGFAHPRTIRYLRENDSDFKKVETYAPNMADRIDPSEKGSIHDIRLLSTTNATVATAGGSGSIDVYLTVILGKNAYGITRIVGEEMNLFYTPPGGLTDPLHQRSALGWKASFVAKRLQEAFMVRLEHSIS